jgi:hypothetical protein
VEPGLGGGGEHAGVLLGGQRKDLGKRVIPDDPLPRLDPPGVGNTDVDEGDVRTARRSRAGLLTANLRRIRTQRDLEIMRLENGAHGLRNERVLVDNENLQNCPPGR